MVKGTTYSLAARAMRSGAISLLLVSTWGASACGFYLGERAATDQCPPGETCSPKTPDGLEFESEAETCPRSLFGDGFPGTAVGGYQTIRIRRPWGDSVPPFEADVRPPIFEVTSVTSDQVTVRALSEGEAYLRIVDPDTGELFDRFSIHAALPSPDIAHYARPVDWMLKDDPLLLGDPEEPFAVLRGARASLQFCFWDDTAALVDERASVWPLSGGADDLEQLAWDKVEVLPPAQGDIRLAIKLGAGSFQVTVPVVEQVENVEVDDLLRNRKEGKCSADSAVWLQAIFWAYDGPWLPDGIQVVHVPLTWDYRGPATEDLTEDGEPRFSAENFLGLKFDGLPGFLTVTVQGGGLERHWTCELMEQSQSVSPKPLSASMTPVRTFVHGERARAALGH